MKKQYLPLYFMIFLWIGVWLDYAHIQLRFPDEYVGIEYGIEISLSELWEIFKRQINKLIQGF